MDLYYGVRKRGGREITRAMIWAPRPGRNILKHTDIHANIRDLSCYMTFILLGIDSSLLIWGFRAHVSLILQP